MLFEFFYGHKKVSQQDEVSTHHSSEFKKKKKEKKKKKRKKDYIRIYHNSKQGCENSCEIFVMLLDILVLFLDSNCIDILHINWI